MPINADESSDKPILTDSNGDQITFVDDGGIKRIPFDSKVTNTSPNDFLSKVSSDDTTSGYLEDKIVAGSSKVSISTASPGSSEQLSIDVNQSNIDHGSLSGLSDDDHTQYLNESRHDSLPQDNPHGVTKAQVGLSDVPNIDATDRANHTGTQLASTISDFITAVKAAETTTSLSLSSNILTYTDEDGAATNIDLSLYLDDTNLARIVSGTINPTTGIVTFTRDDSSTFTIDFSSLLDDQNASEVPVTPSGNLASTDVQAALQELQGDIDTLNTEQGTQDTNISNNASAISAIQTEQTTQNNNISTNQTNISNLQASQATQDTAIALNTAKVSASGSIKTHSDTYDSPTTPVQDDVLAWDNGQQKWIPKSFGNEFSIWQIWAERSGTPGSSWSFGNGQTGEMPVIIDSQCFALSINCATFGTSLQIQIIKNGGVSGTVSFTANNQVVNFPSITFNAGDRITFNAINLVGTFSNTRITAGFRVPSTALFPTPDRQVVNGSNLSFNSGTFTNIPGLTTTVTISATGSVDGTFYYSALRSGFANAVTEYRVVINGNNGQSYIDTLSTFNDTGAVAHFVSGLPPGTYTVTAQAQTDNPITITSCQLVAVGVES